MMCVCLQNVGADGTVYADISLSDDQNQTGPVVRRTNEATEYADIDYNKLRKAASEGDSDSD